MNLIPTSFSSEHVSQTRRHPAPDSYGPKFERACSARPLQFGSTIAWLLMNKTQPEPAIGPAFSRNTCKLSVRLRSARKFFAGSSERLGDAKARSSRSVVSLHR